MNLQEQFWAASIEDLARCISPSDRGFCCLVCGAEFEQGVIYPMGDKLMEAERAAQAHIQEKHKSPLEYLLSLDKKYTGLSESQLSIMRCLADNLDDRACAKELKITPATVRNHRFRLREKAKQARVYLAIMQNIDLPKKEADLVQIHRSATAVDERYASTNEDKAKTLKNYLTPEGRLRVFPAKEKKKIAILAHLIDKFEAGRDYTEPEVNEVIAGFAEDYATLRRYLIQYGFMEREQDCSAYRVKT